jgi:hypothetical protein
MPVEHYQHEHELDVESVPEDEERKDSL